MDADPIVLQSEIPKVPDFTAYLPHVDNLVSELHALSKLAGEQEELSYDCDALITTRSADEKPVKMEPPQDRRRIHACKCFKGSQWSLTIRQDASQGVGEVPSPPVKQPSTNFAASFVR